MDTRLGAKHKVHRAHQTQPRPQEIELGRLVHVKDRKGKEHRERDDLLQDLELPQGQGRVADAIRGHLQEVLKERDPPT